MDKSSGSSKEIEVSDISFYYEEMVRGNLSEVEIETPQGKIILRRALGERDHPLRRKTDFLLPGEVPASAASAAGRALKGRGELPARSKADIPPFPGQTISSPITGIFFRSPSPQSQPFVKEGDIVNANSTLCIVEAMKVMNEIKSEMRCRILRILAENGKPISNGQALFEIESA